MIIDLTQFRCFLALCAELNFSRAAARMHMTQPPFSRHIRLLETQLGVALFDRTTRQVTLTMAGEVLRPQIEAAVQAATAVTVTAQQIVAGKAGRLRLGFTSGAAYALVPQLIAAAQQHLPEVEIDLQERATDDQIAALQAHEIDLGLIRPPRRLDGLMVVGVLRERLKVAVPADHPLARHRTPIAPQALAGENFLLYTPDTNPYLHGLVTGMLAGAGIIPRRRGEIRAIHSLLPLVAIGLGIAVVPAGAEKLQVKNVVFIDFTDDVVQTADHYIVQNRGAAHPVTSTLLKLIREIGLEGQPAG